MAWWMRNNDNPDSVASHGMNGLIGRNCLMSRAHTCVVKHAYNGSGDKAFGGAEKWPVVHLKVSFQEGQEEEAKEFAEKLRNFVYENQPCNFK